MSVSNSFVSGTVKMLIIASLTMSFVGCAQSSSNHNSDNASVSASNIPLPNTEGLSTDAEELHIQSLTGIQCSLFSDLWRNPVLATSRQSYDPGDLQQMAAFFRNLVNQYFWQYHYDRRVHMRSPLLPALRTPPSTLLWVPGTADYCNIDFQITNTGSSAVQIPYADVKLKEAPRRNDFQYRLVDMCTLLPPPKGGYDPLYSYCGPERGSKGGPCGAYYVNITLSNAKKGSVFNEPTAGPSCPVLTLKSEQSTELSFSFASSSFRYPDNLIYSLLPELTLRTSSGSHILTLPQLELSLAFTNDSQISCYGLQGNSFVLEEGGPFGGSHSWCL